MMKRWLQILFLLACPLTVSAADTRHALSLGDPPKYGPDFSHFSYVNPDAPKGGAVRFATVGTFDSLNPFIVKGVAASGIGLLFDTLTTGSDDEPFAEYGLLAESVTIAKDRTWVRFTLRPEARFHNGATVTAEDVVFSFQTLVKKGTPRYARYYHDVASVRAEDARNVVFALANPDNPELPLILGQLPVLSAADWKGEDFSASGLRVPVGSGPYRIDGLTSGKQITYRRDPAYWGRDLAVNRGQYNFDTVTYEYFRDQTVLLEAFKAGQFDFRLENTAKTWATQYNGPALAAGKIIKEEIPHALPAGMQAFAFNIRRDVFSDIRLREAVALAFDFEWSNRALFYNQYRRSNSFFSNSELAAKGAPGPEELALLTPFRDQLPKEVFGPVYMPPATDGSGGNRRNLRKAARILRQAGYRVENGVLKRPTGEAVTFEILLQSPSFERVSLPFARHLKRLGIAATVRVVDPAQYVNRIRSFDFDLTITVFGQSHSPGNEQRDFWGSRSADIPGSRNIIGIQDPVVDALVDAVIKAPDRNRRIVACHALDRVLRWGHYVIPNWHTNVFRVAYWDIFGKPAQSPPYNLPLFTWWVDPDKAKACGR